MKTVHQKTMAKIIIDNQQDALPPPASKSTQLTWVSGLEKQRKKRFSSKVKTGCETCKKRRVKCDEGKPACANCNRSGRRCEGYQSANLGIYWFEHDGKGGSKKPVASTWAGGGGEILFGGGGGGGEDAGGGQKLLKRVDLKYGRDGDKAFLDLFLEKTAVQLVKFSNPYFWYTLVPQASWSHEGIRHGVAAVGLACHEHDFPETKAVSRQTQSIYHYNAAIRALTKTHGRAEATPPDVMLICCVLFWLFENLKNRPCIAMTHLKAAVNMLNERSRPSASREDLVSMYIEPLLQEGMVFAATVLPTGGRQRHEAPATLSAFASVMNNLQPSSSPKDLHAVRYDFLRCQEGLVIAAKMQMSASSPDPDLSLVRKLYSDWSQSLDNNAHRWPADYVRMLRMHYACQMSALDILEANMLNPDNPRGVRDTPEWRSRVQWILQEARYFAHLKQQETNSCAGPNEPIINMSLITLLSITARQSTKNNEDQAEEAISLMQEYEWFEGIWNSKVAGEVVRLMRKVDAEHEFCRRGDLEAVFERAAGIKEEEAASPRMTKATTKTTANHNSIAQGRYAVSAVS